MSSCSSIFFRLVMPFWHLLLIKWQSMLIFSAITVQNITQWKPNKDQLIIKIPFPAWRGWGWGWGWGCVCYCVWTTGPQADQTRGRREGGGQTQNTYTPTVLFDVARVGGWALVWPDAVHAHAHTFAARWLLNSLYNWRNKTGRRSVTNCEGGLS